MVNDSIANWLRDLILGGEPKAWAAIASGTTADGQPLPAELVELAKADEGGAPERFAGTSARLRRICVQAPTSAASAILATVSVLRLSALGHEDREWAALIPRWLVQSVTGEVRGLGLLAVALSERDHLVADDYADLMDESIRLLPPSSPLRSAHLYQYALYLSLRGMLRRIADIVDLPRPGDQEPEVDDSILAECFYDAVCCGRTGQAAFLEQRLSASPTSAWHRDLFHLHRQFIPVYHAILNRQPITDATEMPSAPILRALIAGDRDLLDGFAPEAHESEISPLLGYDALRVALARYDLEQARRLFDSRSAGIARHWLDGLFLARILLLEDRPAEAGAAFARTLAEAERYGAIERLEIELRLAYDLSRVDCSRLGQLGATPGARAKAPASGVHATAPASAFACDEALLAGSSAPAAALRTAVDAMAAAAPSRMLILGPHDGSRRTVASLLHRRIGSGGPFRMLSARASGEADWALQCRQALGENGTLLIDEIEHLSPASQAALLGQLALPHACRLMLGANRELCRLVAEGGWRNDLYWPLARHRLTIPALAERADDAAEIITGCFAACSRRLRWETAARRTLAGRQLPGGWAQLAAIADELADRSPDGVIDIGTLERAIDALCDRRTPGDA